MVYMKNALDVGQWWSSSYEMDSQWSLTPLNGFETEGTFITRYNFDLPNLSKYSHVVIRLYYQDGIALWVNDMQITYDHVEYMHTHLSLNCSGSGSIAMWNPATGQYDTHIWKE